jgi:chromosome segregation ATPase
VAELAASAKSVRSLTAQADQARAALSQAYIDQARIEAERDGLRSTAQQQADALAAERAERERLTRELAGVTARLDAQEQVLAGYRAQLGVAGPAT